MALSYADAFRHSRAFAGRRRVRRWDKQDYKGAAEKYQASIAMAPDAPTGYFFYGDALLDGDAEAALAQYRKGIALDPTLPTGHFFAHTALVELGRRDDAREEIVKALSYYPGYEVIWKIADKPERWNAKPVVRHVQNKLLDGYIFFEIIGQHCPLALATLDDETHDQIEKYIRRYVIVADK